MCTSLVLWMILSNTKRALVAGGSTHTIVVPPRSGCRSRLPGGRPSLTQNGIQAISPKNRRCGGFRESNNDFSHVPSLAWRICESGVKSRLRRRAKMNSLLCWRCSEDTALIMIDFIMRPSTSFLLLPSLHPSRSSLLFKAF